MASLIIDPSTDRPVGQTPLSAFEGMFHMEFEGSEDGRFVKCTLVGRERVEVEAIETTAAQAAGLAMMSYIRRIEEAHDEA